MEPFEISARPTPRARLLPRPSSRMGRGYPIPIPHSLDAFGVSISVPPGLSCFPRILECYSCNTGYKSATHHVER